jgi:hypothetical protein
MRATRHASFWIATFLILLTSACSTVDDPAPLSFPASIDFDGQPLEKAATWEMEGMHAISYAPRGEKPPLASLTVGVILSDKHLTALDLHSWVREQGSGSGDALLFQSDGDDKSCKVAGNPKRTYVAIEVCKTGVARAVCVEADAALEGGIISACGGSRQCYGNVCDRHILERREALDLLAADMLTVR